MYIVVETTAVVPPAIETTVIPGRLFINYYLIEVEGS